jgi:hypothetical protein
MNPMEYQHFPYAYIHLDHLEGISQICRQSHREKYGGDDVASWGVEPYLTIIQRFELLDMISKEY